MYEITKEEITAEELELKDQATIFVLAGAMLTTYRALTFTDEKTLGAVIKQVQGILAMDATFIARFYGMQKEIMSEYNLSGEKLKDDTIKECDGSSLSSSP